MGTSMKEITKKMRIELDNGLRRPDKMEPTRIEITTSEGENYSKVVEHPLGSLERPMTLEDYQEDVPENSEIAQSD